MKAYRVIEYEAPDTESGDAWLMHTFKHSIDGTFYPGEGYRITACEAAGFSDVAEYPGLEHARKRTWVPPLLDSVVARKKKWGDA